MGGILAAEVALQPPSSPATGNPFRHRILGTINLDTPFLGIHPGVIVSGIGSLFRSAPDPPSNRRAHASTSGAGTPSLYSQPSTSSPNLAPSIVGSEFSNNLSPVPSITSTLATPPPNDPFFDPPFPNDVHLPDRKGWTSLVHFINKHSDSLTSATTNYIKSHIEFGSCLADYPGLIDRYDRIRALEDVDELAGMSGPSYRPSARRIRFANYYTASTGRPKTQKIPPGHMIDSEGNIKPVEVEMQEMTLDGPGERAQTPRISIEEHDDVTITSRPLEDRLEASLEAQIKGLGSNSGVQNDVQELAPMQYIDSMPIEDDDEIEPFSKTFSGQATEPTNPVSTFAVPTTTSDTTSPRPETQPDPLLPPIPDPPSEPQPIDLSLYTDKDTRKLAEKEQKRVLKVYQQAVKDRENAIKDRRKFLEKRAKKERQEREKAVKAEEKERLKLEREEQKRNASVDQSSGTGPNSNARSDFDGTAEREGSSEAFEGANEGKAKAKKDRKFCMLPSQTGGVRDKCWIRVYMEGVDEVGAHCGLFFQGDQYESLVGDIGKRIGEWVREDEARRQSVGENLD
jgi:hypothetical protein